MGEFNRMTQRTMSSRAAEFLSSLALALSGFLAFASFVTSQ